MSPTTLATHFDAMRTERRDGQVTVRVPTVAPHPIASVVVLDVKR